MLYFAYGSNIDAADLGLELEAVARAYLPDRQLAFSHHSTKRGGGVLDAIPALGSSVEGVLFKIDAEITQALDLKETSGHSYRRTDALVLTDDGGQRSALFYEVEPRGRTDFVPPAEGYVEIVRRGRRGFALDDEPLEAAVGGVSHPGPVRSLFVYGTLLEGESRHEILLRHGLHARFDAHVPGALVDLRDHPGLMVDRHANSVTGECYLIPRPDALFHELDAIEGSDFRRAIMRVQRTDRSVLAWVYVYTGTDDGGKMIPSGSWRAH